MAETVEQRKERQRRWYQDRRAESAGLRNHAKLVKAAKPAALGLPDKLAAALTSLGPQGEYDDWAREALLECEGRGLVDRLEECGPEQRATVSEWGRAVLEALASVDTHPKGGDAKQAPCVSMGSAVPREDEADAQGPSHD